MLFRSQAEATQRVYEKMITPPVARPSAPVSVEEKNKALLDRYANGDRRALEEYLLDNAPGADKFLNSIMSKFDT